MFDSYLRENKTFFADAPEYGIPVVLRQAGRKTQSNVISEIESLVTEFEKKIP